MKANFKNFLKKAGFFRKAVLYWSSRQKAAQYPGVAKFGIALEWGSRGLEFESRHSDHVGAGLYACSDLFFT